MHLQVLSLISYLSTVPYTREQKDLPDKSALAVYTGGSITV